MFINGELQSSVTSHTNAHVTNSAKWGEASQPASNNSFINYVLSHMICVVPKWERTTDSFYFETQGLADCRLLSCACFPKLR